MSIAPNFIADQERTQAAFLSTVSNASPGYLGKAYRLPPDQYLLNLAEPIREQVEEYFDHHQVVWHEHASHGLSSQVCCLNFLAPLAHQPERLCRLIGRAVGAEPSRMLPIEVGRDDANWFVGFEWIGDKGYINEWPKIARPRRGAHVTSADAVVRFESGGLRETLLIEWKYTERYSGGLPDKRSADGLRGGNLTRQARYKDAAFSPNGPIHNEPGLMLSAFFYEPFYQLLRQQMMAWHTEKDTGERVRVLHISPHANQDLHAVTSPWFAERGHTDVFDAFKAVLAPPDDGVPRFVSRYTEDLFGPLLAQVPDDPWAAYLTGRYPFLQPAIGEA